MSQNLSDRFGKPPSATEPANRNKPPLMLCIKKKDGSQLAAPFAYRTFIVRGIRLQTLFDGLLEHAIAVIAESDNAFEREASPDRPYVEAIETGEG